MALPDRRSARRPGFLPLGILCLLLLGIGQACTEARAPARHDEAATVGDGYPGSGGAALFLSAENRLGGATGGFARDVGPAEYSYRLGTGISPVPEAEVAALLAEYRERILLAGDQVAALRTVVSERTAFAAWSQFFADGGRVRAYTPLGREDLARLPPSKLVLAGKGRYIPDRLVIIARADEPDMAGFLFHEIQHYIFDRWDSPLFEAGEADHAVIRILEERRRMLESIRLGRVPSEPSSLGVLHEAPDAGAGEGMPSPDLYHTWVRATRGRVLAKNEANRGVRIVSTVLSSGDTLLLDERSDRDSPDEIKTLEARVPPHYRFGPVVYVSLADMRRFDAERLFDGGYVPEADRPLVTEFIRAHRQDWGRGRGHIFSEAEIRDMAHLSAFNAAIFQQAFRLADFFRDGTALGFDEVMGEPRFQAAFSDFLAAYVDRMTRDSGADPGRVATGVLEEVLAHLHPSLG